METEINVSELQQIRKMLYDGILKSKKRTINVSISDAEIIHKAIGQLLLIVDLKKIDDFENVEK